MRFILNNYLLKFKLNYLKYLIPILSIFISFLFIEILLITIGIKNKSNLLTAYNFDNRLGWDTKKNFRYYRSSNSYAHWNYYNDEGHLVSKINFKNKTSFDKDNIILIGDSFVEGYYVSSTKSFAVKLDNSINEIQFINGGISGYSPEQYKIKFDQLYAKYSKNNIHNLVFLFPYNDIPFFGKTQYEGFSKPKYNLNKNSIDNLPLKNIKVSFEEEFQLKFLLTKTRIYQIIRPLFKQLFFEKVNVYKDDINLYKYPLSKFEEIIKFFNDTIFKLNNNTTIVYIPVIMEYVFNVYESNFENFNKICEENNINCIKLLDYNINYNEIYIDEDGHFNENGSCIAAINLSNYLVQKKIIKTEENLNIIDC